jgi:hypothetical protein
MAIQFRCWYCNKRYSVADNRIGQRITCTCKSLLRVPKRNGGPCRVKTLTDWLVETVVYGGGGGLLGFGLGVLILSQWRSLVLLRHGWAMVATLTVLGFIAGLLGGEWGVNRVGRMIRDQEER